MQNLPRLTWLLAAMAIFLAGNLIFTACEKSDVPNQITANESILALENIRFEDGRLKFDSRTSFESAIEKLSKLSQKDLKKTEDQFTGFESNYMAYKKMIRENGENLNPSLLPSYMTAVKGEDGETYLKNSVDFKILQHLVNKNGIYQVADSVIKITYTKWYIADQSLVGTLEYDQNLDNNPKITAYTIKRETDVTFERGAFMQCAGGYGGSPYPRKFHGEVNNVSGPYNEVRTDFDHYKRGIFGAWFHKDAPAMDFSGSVNTQCCTSICRDPLTGVCPTLLMSTSMSGSDESEIFDVLLTCCVGICGGSCSAISGSSVTFTGVGDLGGFNFSCTATK